MIIFQILAVLLFWTIWWFVAAFIGDQIAEDSDSNKRASTRFATVLATIPLIALFGYRLMLGAPLLYGSTDAFLIFLPYLGVLTLISSRS
ncbi:MAG: hypothetical protein WC030_01710 [Candidatus Paceibacterota bacterium]